MNIELSFIISSVFAQHCTFKSSQIKSCVVLPKGKTETLSLNSAALEFNRQIFLFVCVFVG